MREILLLQRLALSPFARPYLWQEDAVLALRVRATDGSGREDAYTIATNLGQPLVKPGLPATADAEVRCSDEDIEAMLTGQLPPREVVMTLGAREVPAWRAQARGVLLLAALGWAGMWPDPDAEEDHEILVRGALLDLSLGRADARVRLFGAPGPAGLGEVEVRVRDGARGRELNTEGLSLAPDWGARSTPSTAGSGTTVSGTTVSGTTVSGTTVSGGVRTPPGRPAELGTVLARGETLTSALRRLRAAALWQTEHRGFPTVLDLGPEAGPRLRLSVGPHPLFPHGMPLPRGRVWLLDVSEAPAAPSSR